MPQRQTLPSIAPTISASDGFGFLLISAAALIICPVGQAPVKPLQETIPVEQLEAMKEQTPTNPPMPVIQYVPVMVPQAQQGAPAAAPPAPAPATSAAPK